MPPRPRSATTRYRPASSVPGRNLPSSSEPNETGVAGLDPDMASVTRVPALALSDTPHCGQKRTLSEMLSPHDRHCVIEIHCNAGGAREESVTNSGGRLARGI